MSFKKPFRAVPIKLGRHYRDKERVRRRMSVIKILVLAVSAGALIGVGSVAFG